MAASVALLDGPVSHVEGGGVFPLGLMVYLRHVTVKTGTSPLGPHQGRKTTVAHLSSLHLLLSLHQTLVLPRCLSLPGEREDEACQRNVCAHAQACRGWREDSRRGVFSL